MLSLTRGGVLVGVLVVVVAAVCIRLGIWQLDRLEERRARNAEVEAALAAPPLLLDSATALAVAAEPSTYRYRRAAATGVWDERSSFLLRGRSHQGRPGVHLVTVLRLQPGGVALLVDRGWLPAADATTADPRPYREPGRVEVQGAIHPAPAGGEAGRVVEVEFDGVAFPTYQRLDPAVPQREYDLPVLPFYLERAASPGAAEPPIGASAPVLDEGPHLGYAVQWFAFAAIAVIGFGVVVARRPATGRGA